MRPRPRRRSPLVAALVVIALTAVAACSGRGKAEPARVEIEWPDAGAVAAPESSKPEARPASPAARDGGASK